MWTSVSPCLGGSLRDPLDRLRPTLVHSVAQRVQLAEGILGARVAARGRLAEPSHRRGVVRFHAIDADPPHVQPGAPHVKRGGLREQASREPGALPRPLLSST